MNSILFEKARITAEKLAASGYEAYFVGGCVRDMLMGRECHDIDITTDALPEEIISVFSGEKMILTGMKHGTVTVVTDGIPFEITTYRIDGEYSDFRRPDSVTFTKDITADLSRRDLTVNAMAMGLDGTIIDPFGGRNDIEKKTIRCVGEPEKRFTEDALRILRAMRFSSQLGFEIEEKTAYAVISMRSLLKNISAERIRDEIDKLICGINCIDVLLRFSDVIVEVIPEFAPCVGFDQHSPYHKYTVWEHIVRAVASAPADDLMLRRSLFFHDIAKPVCATFDETGRGHFKGHDEVGAEMTGKIMRRMHYDKRSTAFACDLIARHSRRIIGINDCKRLMSEIGDELFFELMRFKKCDNSAKHDFVREENAMFDRFIREGKRIIAADECRGMANLAVSGDDIKAIGLKGKAIGEALREMLSLVIDEKLPNDKKLLIEYAEQRWTE